MAARTKRIVHDANTRAKIQATQLINRLTRHINTYPEAEDYAKNYMDKSQVSAALGLLRKTLPDLQSVELDADVKGQVTIQIVQYANGQASA